MSDPITRLNAALEGRYRIGSELGEGGMATVYLADDLKHERKVALKVLKPELAAVVGAERFLAEIKTTANLQHPHILPLHDSGEADGFLYYVMPYIEGETLGDRLGREKQLPVDEAVRIAKALANALQTAHEQGIVHRDIKPANILLSRGEPLVADFGIALAVGAAGGSRLTETGLSVGTPFYMSPEQATGDQSVGPASDTYSLACVLYEMLVGEPPYIGNTAQAVLGKIIQGAFVSPATVRKAIPPNVDAATRKALERLPADRFADAQSFAKALDEPSFRHGTTEAAAAPIRRWSRLTVGLAASTAALSLALGWSLFWDTRSLPQGIERYSLALLAEQMPNEQLSVSPDGSALVFRHTNDDGDPQLFLRRWDDLRPTPIPGTAGDLHDPAISPDGTEVAYVQNSQLKVVPLDGGLVRTLASEAACCSRWGPDGYLYFSAVGRSIRRIPFDGNGEVEQVTEIVSGDDGNHGYFQVLPEADVAVFTVWATPRRIEALRMSTGERKALTEGVRSYVTPDGYLVFASLDGQLLAAPFDADAMELSGPAIPLIDGVGVTAGEDAMYTVSEGGTLVYWSTRAFERMSEFVQVTRSGAETVIEPGWYVDLGPVRGFGWSLSPDGTRLAMRELTPAGLDIWVKSLPDGPRSRLTFDAAEERKPRWAPDGQTILFLSPRSGEVWSVRADGTGEAEVVAGQVGTEVAFWNSDREYLVFLGVVGTSWDILAQRMSDTTVLRLLTTGYQEQGPALSPDGRWLAYSSDETGRNEVFVRPFPDIDSGKAQVSAEGGIKPVWAHSGSELFFVDSNNGLVAAEVETEPSFRVTGQQTLFVIPVGYVVDPSADFYAIAPDDESFVMARPVHGEAGSEARPELIVVRNWLEELRQRMGGE